MLISRLGFQWNIPLGRIQLSIDPLVPIIMGVLGWLFADQYYPLMIDAKPLTYWIAGGATSIGLFGSILIHELGHAKMASYRGQVVPQIHLFAFGGMAVLDNRKLAPIDEMLIAVAGPAVSLIVALVSWGIGLIPVFNTSMLAGIQVLASLNALIAIFNIIPIYPLDGGRILRSLLAMGSRVQLEASILTYRIGSILIALLFVVAIGMYANQAYMLSVGLGTAGFYLSYMALNGKRHLIKVPQLHQLYVTLDRNKSPLEWIEALFQSDFIEIESTLIPIQLDQDSDIKVIHGADYLNWAQGEQGEASDVRSLEDRFKLLSKGNYIDFKDLGTFQNGIRFNAQFVPFLRDEQLIGVCKADEMRYWLHQKLNSKQANSILRRSSQQSEDE